MTEPRVSRLKNRIIEPVRPAPLRRGQAVHEFLARRIRATRARSTDTTKKVR
jgi:hypothetical protein